MIIFDRDGSTTFCGSVCGEGLLIQHPTPTPIPTQQQTQPELINKNIIDIIKKIRERLTNPSSSVAQQSSLVEQKIKQGFENI